MCNFTNSNVEFHKYMLKCMCNFACVDLDTHTYDWREIFFILINKEIFSQFSFRIVKSEFKFEQIHRSNLFFFYSFSAFTKQFRN